MTQLFRAAVVGVKPAIFLFGLGVLAYNAYVNLVRGHDYMDFLVILIGLFLASILIGSFKLDNQGDR